MVVVVVVVVGNLGKSDMLDKTGNDSMDGLDVETTNNGEFHRKISGFQVKIGPKLLGSPKKGVR